MLIIMTIKTSVRNAQENEAERLTQLTLRSKASWGYSDSLMKSWESGLTVHASDIADPLNIIRVIENGVIEGFYFLRIKDSTNARLRFFFIDPLHQRKGFGSVLFEDLVRMCKEKGVQSIMMESDPHAEIFYRKCGAVTIDYVPSGTAGERPLPLMEYKMKN